MKTYPLLISSPDGDLFRGEVQMLIVRGTEGDLAVLAGHVPFVTGIAHGACVLVDAEGTRKEGVMEDGILTVDRDRVTVLTSGLAFDQK